MEEKSRRLEELEFQDARHPIRVGQSTARRIELHLRSL